MNEQRHGKLLCQPEPPAEEKNLMKFHLRREMISSILLTEAKKVIVKEVFCARD